MSDRREAAAAFGLRRAVCRRCGGGRFVEYGEVSITAEVVRPIKEITLSAAGIGLRRGAIEDDDLDLYNLEDHASFFGFACRECDDTARTIDELTVAEPRWGDRVNLPDGRTARVADVRSGGGRLEVRAADEWWCFDEMELWQPHPGQLRIEAVAA